MMEIVDITEESEENSWGIVVVEKIDEQVKIDAAKKLTLRKQVININGEIIDVDH